MEYEEKIGTNTYRNTNPGRWCDHCANWFNAETEGVKGKVENVPYYCKTVAYCGKCCTNEKREHKTLY